MWGIDSGTEEEIAEAAIVKTEEFFQFVEIKTTLSEYTEDYRGTAQKISERFTTRGWLGLGENKSLKLSDVKRIVEMSY